MKTLLKTLSLFLLVVTVNAQDKILKLSDFEILNNTSWKGQLTYKDYQSGNPKTIDATMQIEIKGDRIIRSIQYTYEPNKNNRSSVKIKRDGTYFGNEKVVSNTLENGVRTFVTTYDGKDDGKKATLFITHQFSVNSYKVTKEVQFKGSNEKRFVRNTYEFIKI